jgi:signal transduction histidine kinase
MNSSPDPLRIDRLLDAGRALVADLDPQAVLGRALAAAREITGARYAALGILDGQRQEVEQFLTLGIDCQSGDEIDELPRARGVIGSLVEEACPLRVSNFADDPSRVAMRGCLGVPIMIRGVAWGGLYLAEKEDDEFTAVDEEAVVILADWAATAVERAHQYRHSERRRAEREQELHGPEATPAIALAVGGDTGLARVLDLVVTRGRALVDARSADLDNASGDQAEQSLRGFAASAATAVAMAEGMESDRLRSLVAAGDAERRRWARELHDETLQGLGAVRLLLASARRRGIDVTLGAVDEAIEQIEREIENLHAIISDLRPAALDELGLRPALEALLERRGDHGHLMITATLDLPDSTAGSTGLEPEVESTVYRVVQESLTNIVKHAKARTVHVSVTASDISVSIHVRDDGVGFAPAARATGFGLTGIRERVRLAGGTVHIESGEGGTAVRAELPVHTRRQSDKSRFERAAQ